MASIEVSLSNNSWRKKGNNSNSNNVVVGGGGGGGSSASLSGRVDSRASAPTVSPYQNRDHRKEMDALRTALRDKENIIKT